MSSINGSLPGEALLFRLGDGRHEELIDNELLTRVGRSARTLIKAGPLRVTLVALAAGGTLAEHRANGPITVHALSGDIHFRAGTSEWNLEPGDLLSLAAGVRHQVDSISGGTFLLTAASSAAG